MKWRKLQEENFFKAGDFLKGREKFCVSASARFLGIRENKGRVWYLDGGDGEISALLLHSRRALFPVFNKNSSVPAPRFLNRFPGKVNIHAVQGLREDVELLEALMENHGCYASERIDYNLMNLDETPRPEALRGGPAGLTLRPPHPQDAEDLFNLQAAYEQEEVLPKNAEFNPGASRLNLQNILSKELVLVACLEGRVVGKINTSAESFTRRQIGGVYVRPDYRSLGIGLKMTAVFAQNLINLGRGVTLFVKKRNAAAITIYRKTGFSVLGDYRISYF